MIPCCLSVLLISFGMIFSSSIHDVANGNISFFFGSHVFSHPANLCLLSEEFNPFIFEVIPDKEELTSVYVSSICLIVFLPLISCITVFFCRFFVVKSLNFFLISFCVYSTTTFFVGTMGITFNMLKF